MRAESRLSWLAVAAGSALCAAVAGVGADARWLSALGEAISRAGHIPSSIPYAEASSHVWVNVPVLGLVENMSHFVCPTCRHESDIFGKGGGEVLAGELSVPFLGRTFEGIAAG